MTPVRKYRMLVQARTDLTEAEIKRRLARQSPKTVGPPPFPFRDTGEIVHARRRNQACAFYRALRQIKPIIKIRAVRINDARPARRNDGVAIRAWFGFRCLSGVIAHGGVEAGDEVKHFAVPINGDAGGGLSACGLKFTSYWAIGGKPECDKCLAAAVEAHPEMKQYL